MNRGAARASDDQLADARKHIRKAIDSGDDRHRKQLLNALIAEIRVDSRDSITPVYRVPHAQQVDMVRIVEGQVGMALHNANRHDLIDGPAIAVSPLHARPGERRPSYRNAVLDAIVRLQARTGATEFARRDLVAEVHASSAAFDRQTVYRCIRCLTGGEPGSAHRDLEDLARDQVRARR